MLFDPHQTQPGDRVLLQFTGERLPRKLSGTWATVDRGPMPGSHRIKVRADSETDYPRKIELAEIREIAPDGRTIARRVHRPGAFPLETVERRPPARWEIVRRSYNTGRVLKIVARDIPEYAIAREQRQKWRRTSACAARTAGTTTPGSPAPPGATRCADSFTYLYRRRDTYG